MNNNPFPLFPSLLYLQSMLKRPIICRENQQNLNNNNNNNKNKVMLLIRK